MGTGMQRSIAGGSGRTYSVGIYLYISAWAGTKVWYPSPAAALNMVNMALISHSVTAATQPQEVGVKSATMS